MLLVWAAVVSRLLLLLAQRTFFVRGLVAQADEASGAMLSELDRVPPASRPAQAGRACGFRPTRPVPPSAGCCGR